MDFLAGIKKTGSSCGMHLKGRTVLKVVKGSPAHFAEIREGDTIAAIDGQRGEDQMAAALGSHQRIGSICTASVVRRGERLEVELARTQVSAMQRTEELIDFVELSCEHDPELRAALLEYVEGLERERQYEERVLAGRLNRMATSLLQSVTRAANTLAPAPPAAPDFDVDALMAAERRERARGDALEKQLGEAQSRIDVLECSEEHLKEQLEELRRQLAAMVPAAELAAAQEENTGLRREVEGLRREMLGMVGRGELEAAQRECEGLQAQLEALKQQMANMVPRSELEKAEEELRGSKAQAAALAAEVEGLRREMLGMVGRGELEAAQRECEGLQAQLEALKQQMANMVPRSELEKAETELRATKERAEALEQKVSGLEAELRGSQKECGELREKLATAERELKAATELAASLEAKVSGLEAELRGSQKECGELREKLATTETELKASKERAADLEKQNAELKEAAEKLEVKVAGLEAKVVSLSVPDFDTRGSTFTKKLPIAIRGREGSMIYANVRPSSAEAAPPTKEAFDTCVQSPLVLLLEESCVVSAASALEGFALSEVRSEEFTLETPPPPPPELVGVGMVVSRPKDAAAEPKDGKEAVAEVRVKEIDEGSPVQIDGTIAVGDVLVEVDGQGVAGLSMSEISDLILGPAGSEVSLLLEKAEFRGRREPAGMYTAKLARAKSERQVGVGMMLSRPRPKAEGDGDDVSRNILVKEIYSGCAVAENGVIEVGDIVLEINDQHVAEMAMSDIERLIKGKEGSEITFVVQKPTEEKVAVTLVRKKEPDGIVTRVFDQSISLLDNGRNLVMGQLQSVQSLLTPRKGSTIMYPDGTSETVYWAV